MNRKTIKTLASIMATMMLMLTACSNGNIWNEVFGTSSLPSGERTSRQVSQASQSTDAPTLPQGETEPTLIVEKRSEREFAFCVRVPNLLDYAETNEDYSIRITFGDGHVFWLQPFEETYDSRIYASGSDFDVMGDVDHEKGIIWGLVHMPDTVAFEWETIDTFEMEAPKRQRGVEDYTFARADIEAPVEEVPNLHELTEFRIDRSAISLKAKDNGDGTLTFTYRDSSMKPYYSYPWSWFEQVESVYMNFGCLVGGKLDYDPDSTEVAIGSSFAFNRRVGEFDYDYNLWHQMTIDMREALMLEDPMEIYWMERGTSGFYKPDGFSVIVDESGLSATWTQAFEPGYTFDDIAAFQVILSYQIFNEENEAVLFSAEEDSEQSFGFEIEEVME